MKVSELNNLKNIMILISVIMLISKLDQFELIYKN